MESVAPKRPDPDDETPPDGLRLVVDRVTRLETKVGDFGEGLVKEVRTVAAAQIDMFGVVCAVRDEVQRLSAQLVKHELTEAKRREDDKAQREEERREDGRRINLLFAGQIVSSALTVACTLVAVLMLRGCP